MSASLVQKSLRVLKDDIKGNRSAVHKKKIKELKRPINYLDNKKTRITVIEARNTVHQKKKESENNLQKLQLLSSRKIDSETASKVFEKIKNHSTVTAEISNQPEPTAFTEEDFLNFEKEYFCS